MNLPTFRFAGQVFRAHNPRWNHLPESGEGARYHGGRFNPRGVAALYTSADLTTAWAEAQQGFPFKPQPLTICTYEVDCEDLLDLADAAVRSQLDIRDDQIACPWEDISDRGGRPPSWDLYDRLFQAGAAGIRVRSFAPGCGADNVNMVFWRWSANLPYMVRVIDDDNRLGG